MKPKKVNDAELAFGGKMDVLLPKMSEIPKEFINGNTKWNKFINAWFYYGSKKTLRFTPKEGINKDDAIRHLRAILVSFEPKHEHKMDGCAYLLSHFFEDVSVEDAPVENIETEKTE